MKPRGLMTGAELFSTDEQGLDRVIEANDARLVEPDGIEPTTSCLQSRRSPN